MKKKKCVFLDRDGVIVDDVNLLTEYSEIRIPEGVPQALAVLKKGGFLLIVVTNQTTVSRGLATENRVVDMNNEIRTRIEYAGGPCLDHFYFCPHHPNATLPEYRAICDCRKPRAGMIYQAAREWSIDIKKSFLVGDRITDIIAGYRAGCKTILVKTGAHLAPPIETTEKLDLTIKPDFACANLREATRWILSQS